MVALHSTDPATVYVSAWARCPTMLPDDLDTDLYDVRSLIRIHAMRRTMWVVPTDRVSVFDASVGAQVAARERTRLLKMVAEHIDEPVEGWFDRCRSQVLEYLHQHEFAYAEDLRTAVPEFGLRIEYGTGTFGVGPRVLFQMAVEGDIVRTSPRGSWRSNVYAWTLRDRWLPDPPEPWDEDAARAELARWWLEGFGPGTLDDLVWWTGWGKRVTRRALQACEAVEVDLDGEPGFVASGDTDEPEPADPWVALLPSLDPTTMGWKNRQWYLGEHASHLFDRNGNAGPTVWADGRVVGGWAQQPDGAIVVGYLEAIEPDVDDLVTATAERLQSWLGDHVVVPRFRTPMETELTSRKGDT